MTNKSKSKKNKKIFPARLHVLFAKNTSYGVVIRRGPSDQVCTFGWDRRDDSFAIGQWLKGKIYERRSDLSPDGKYMIYFAMNHKYQGKDTGGTWTAVSKAPYLRAIELYAKGDAWEGGGLFLSNKTYWLNDRYFTRDQILVQSSEVKRIDGHEETQEFGAECRSVYYRRLMRDGWTYIDHVDGRKAFTIFEKKLPKGWVLRKIAHENCDSPAGNGCYWDQHKLINEGHQLCFQKFDWEWAERDGNDVVWAAKGCLYRAKISSKEVGEPKLLHDFNAYSFKAIKAPYDNGSRFFE